MTGTGVALAAPVSGNTAGRGALDGVSPGPFFCPSVGSSRNATARIAMPMLLWFVDWLARAVLGRPVCQSLEKTTLRGALAAVISFALALLFGRQLIAWLRGRFREPIKTASPRVAELHAAKEATPTMGGLFIAAGIVISTAAAGRHEQSAGLAGRGA